MFQNIYKSLLIFKNIIYNYFNIILIKSKKKTINSNGYGYFGDYDESGNWENYV